jgi:transposase-like protein
MTSIACPDCGSHDTRPDPDPRRAWQHCDRCRYQWSRLNPSWITGEFRKPDRGR